jgi:hypothetical protein
MHLNFANDHYTLVNPVIGGILIGFASLLATVLSGKIPGISGVFGRAAAEKLCKESGHWKIAQQLIGTSFVYAPLGVEGLLRHPAAAKILDDLDSEEMRRGFTTGLFNLRGVHGYTHGQEELKLANTYSEFAIKFDLAGFVQIAAALRGIAEGYKRESEREAKTNPYLMN